ncbi:sulfite exporter TauE/SafE family protein [Candidatus Thiodiazotropha sp. CDECU1]|uniref:sulfite exporter TauE/SafE family protein n=1 Tax=Candidatus Thiodiazotropha sp. CDECU1 TaxID=3065865 RepID=UPI00292D9B0D|nr:sulfite exporter TauE/SafE family protein [Candidatus Thiodiazotropha sp. CDECU1]
MTYQLLFLFAAGFFGGVLNAIAGGGSFITFPALLFVGVAPISANATNTFASCAGYMSGAYALRKELLAYRAQLPRLIIVSLVGGSTGALLLLLTPESVFRQAIPWLLLFATLLFIFGGRINRALKQYASGHPHASLLGALLLLLLLLGISVYGGFFNAGLGIIILSYLALEGFGDINAMNGLKLLISSVVSLIAIALFIVNGAIAWYAGIVVMFGTLVGGYVAAHLSRQLPQTYVRTFVILAGSGMSLYFFLN